MHGRIGVIIPAAGAGKRLGGMSKPLITVAGKPLVVRILDLFGQVEGVSEICVAVPREHLPEFESAAKSSTASRLVKIVPGGDERAISVRKAFAEFSETLSDEDLVCIHDAARPLLSREDLERVTAAGWKYGAAFLASKVKDTLKVVDGDGYCTMTVDRSRLFAAQTPQVMKAGFLSKAYAEIGDYSAVTDEITLMERIGVKAFVVESNHLNLKLTTPDDLDLIEKLIS